MAKVGAEERHTEIAHEPQRALTEATANSPQHVPERQRLRWWRGAARKANGIAELHGPFREPLPVAFKSRRIPLDAATSTLTAEIGANGIAVHHSVRLGEARQTTYGLTAMPAPEASDPKLQNHPIVVRRVALIIAMGFETAIGPADRADCRGPHRTVAFSVNVSFRSACN